MTAPGDPQGADLTLAGTDGNGVDDGGVYAPVRLPDARLGLRPEQVHRVNRSIVFDTIAEFGPISRRALCSQLGLSATMVNELVAELADYDLIRESGTGPSGGGRPPTLLGASSRSSYALAFAIRAGWIDVLACDPGGSVWAQTSRAVAPDLDPRAALAKVIEAGREVVGGLAGRQLIAVGAAWAAPVDWEGHSHPSDMRSWSDEGVDLAHELSEAFGVPAVADNDANLGALAELRLGVARGRRHLVYILVHEGVGAGVVMDRKLYGGARNLAGELGHTVIDRGGEQCVCGNFGCVETVVSTTALARYWHEGVRVGRPTGLALDGPPPRTEEIIDAAVRGDRGAGAAIEKLAELMGTVVSNVATLFDPEIIVLGGPITAAGDLLLEPARAITTNRGVGPSSPLCDIALSAFGARGACMGAAVHAIDEILLHLPKGGKLSEPGEAVR
jgi:predicted NBD/HSP70 family sugar kinase